MEKALAILKNILHGSKTIAVGVSGGSDSMALLHLLKNCDFLPKESILVVHVNHLIRGEDAHADEKFVMEFCAQNNVPFKAYTADVPALAAAKGLSLECAARNVRRGIFLDLINSGVVNKVLLAHHADDNAETVLMHILRGCGIKGLRGMEIEGKDGITRPLLTTSKEEIDQYIHANNIEYVTDKTNDDTCYDRNFIRHEVFPLLQKRYSGAKHSLNRLSRHAAAVYGATENAIENNQIETVQGIVSVDCECLKGVGAAEIVFYVLEQLDITQDVFTKNIEEALKVPHLQNGKSIDICQGVAAVKEYGKAVFYKKNSINYDLPEVAFLPGCVCGDYLVSMRALNKSEAKKFLKLPVKERQGALLLDVNKIPAYCVVRSRKKGDLFKPFKSGTKKLKEYLIDCKIPKRLRDRLPLLCYGSNVLAILGMQISDDLKVDEHSNPVVLYLEKISQSNA